MKAKIVRYERLSSLGNFEHEKIAIELEVGEGETAQDVLTKARVFVNTNLINKKRALEIAKATLQSSRDFASSAQVKNAEQLIAEFDQAKDLIF